MLGVALLVVDEGGFVIGPGDLWALLQATSFGCAFW